MDIMKAVESGMGSHSQLLSPKLSQRYLEECSWLWKVWVFEGLMFSNLRGVGIEWY